MKIVYDPVLKRPGCVLLQAAMGGDPKLAQKFKVEDWLLAPTPNIGCFPVTEEQLAKLISITETRKQGS